jgi:glucokinase
VALLNDLAANGLGLSELSPADLHVLNAGVDDPTGTAALLSAGTGLGEAILLRESNGFRVLPSEGGHASFAPRDEHETRLLLWLAERHGHVSYERVVSGIGFAELYRFEREVSGEKEPAWLGEEIARTGDVGRCVSGAALARRDGVAVRTLERFARILGSEAGNLCLKALATGGLYLGGGIAPKILSKLEEGSFLAAMADKGRMGPMLSRIPVRVILNDSCALLGAARAGANLAASGVI